MTEFGVNQSKALGAISKINFTEEEYFNEFIGGLSTEAKSYLKMINNHEKIKDSINIYGDDEGFTTNNRNSFKTTYDSNGYGLGEHGCGCRAAFNAFMKIHMGSIMRKFAEDEYFFGIISSFLNLIFKLRLSLKVFIIKSLFVSSLS